MRFNQKNLRLLCIATTFGCVLMNSQAVLAQDTPAPAAEKDADKGKKSKSAIFAGANLPEVAPARFLPDGEVAIQEMRTALRIGLDTLRQARQAKDAVRLNCVNDRITAMKGIMKISEDAYIALQEAMATSAIENARYEFGKIQVSRQKMRDLKTQAENCAGAEATFSGDTNIEVEEEPSAAVTETYYDPSTESSFFDESNTGESVSNGLDEGLSGEPEAGSDSSVGGGIDSRPPVASVAEETTL
jgi:hypothetical protein